MMDGGYTTWQNNTHPNWWRDPGLRKNIACIVLLFSCVFTFGYDGSLLNGLQGLPAWRAYFKNPKGSHLGLISASYYFPKIPFAFVVAYLNERYGRRMPILAGSILCIAGAFIVAFANGDGMLIGGRVVLGVGTSLHAVSAPPLIHELSHPRLRAILASCYLSFYYVGSTASAWLCYGMTISSLKGDWTWRLPALVQALGPFVVLVGWFWLPESPRWLMSQGREEEAIRFYEAHHANGASIENDELVRMEVAEIRESMEIAKRTKQQNYLSFFKTPGNRHRLLIILCTGAGSQLAGNGIVAYYLPSILRLIGITSPKDQAGINGGIAIMNLFVAFAAGTQVERLGRRFFWLAGTTGMFISFVVVSGLSGSYATKASPMVGQGVVAFLFLFYASYDVSFTALPNLYIPEILPFDLRSKGIALYSTTASISLAFNQWVNPIALEAIQWKYYIVYVGVLAAMLTVQWFKYIETKGRTPEEIQFLFDKDVPVIPSTTTAHPSDSDSEIDLGKSDDKDGKQDFRHVEHARLA